MNLHSETAEIFVPDGSPEEPALSRTTHLAVAAHQDDIEIMAFDGILKSFQNPNSWFSGIVMTNGGGSPRAGLYKNFTDEEMIKIRQQEQRKAAIIGEYSCQVLLNYSSAEVKNTNNDHPTEDLVKLLIATKPETVYTHNPADKHDTHVAVVVRVINALRQIPPELRPKKVYGCEVWRSLDWLLDENKVAFNISSRENLQLALLGVFDSQITGGKRYDLATMGRRRANATYYASHDTDTASGMIFAMDLTPLIQEDTLDIAQYVQEQINLFAKDVSERLGKFIKR